MCPQDRPRYVGREGATGRIDAVDVDDEQRKKAVQRLMAHGGLDEDEAERLVDAAVAGAVDHAFELINGASAVPTAMTTARADQLRFICDRAGRLVSEREVEILFRITGRTAKSTINTMMATYEEALRDEFLARMRSDAKVLKSGSTEDGLTWTIRFSESSTFDSAWTEVQRLGLASEAESNSSQRKITLPRAVGEVDVLDALAISKPEE